MKIDYVSTRVEKEDLEKLFGKYGRVGDVASLPAVLAQNTSQHVQKRGLTSRRLGRCIYRAIPMVTEKVSHSSDITRNRSQSG